MAETNKETDDALIDSLRLRAALLLACIELTGSEDMLDAWELAEEFYDAAPGLLAKLEEDFDGVPQPGQVLYFPSSKSPENN